MLERFFKTKNKLSLRIAAGFLCCALFSETSLAASFAVNYSGRLARSDGSPVEGPVSIQVKFWNSSTDGAQIGQTLDYSGINLSSGVFALDLVFTAEQVAAVFGDGSSPVYLELTSQNITYPRQQFSYVPFALRVPVDSKIFTFDEDGKLTFTAGAKPGANQFLTTGTDGKLTWAAPLAPTIQNQAIAAGTPSSGQVLTYNGSQWTSSNPTGGNGSGSSVNLSTGVTGTLAVMNGGTGVTSFANNGVLVGAGNLPVSTATGSQYQVFTSSAGGTLGFGAVNLAQSAAVSGVLPTANGGTGVNSTATFPVSGVVVTRDATETLTNKTITTATVNGNSTIGGSTEINTTGTIASGAATVFGNVTVRGNGTGANKLILNDKGSTNSVSFKAPDTLASSVTWELPSADGSNGQVLATNGSGTLSWTSGLAPTGAAGGDLTGAFPNPTLINVGTAGAYSKVVVDSKGRVTSGSSLAASDIPNLSAGQITSGTLNSAQLPTAGTAGTYAKVTTDTYGRVSAGTTLVAADLPPHSAALITSGTLNTAQLPTAGTAGTYAKVTTDAYGRVTAGTALASGDITSSLGFTPINKAGDTMTGALNHGGTDIVNAGNIQMAASKTLALSGNTADPSGLVSGDKGKTWFNSTTNQIKYWDGSAAVALGVSGAGLSSFNGQTGNTQTLAAPGTTGTAPTWVSAANAHTLNIPLASTASVTAGLISNTDYNTFNGKVAGVTSGTGVTVSTTGNIATVNLATAGTVGTYAKVTTDAYGRVTAGTTLVAGDLPPHSAALITSGTLNTAQLPTAGTAGTYAKVTTDAYGRVTAGTTLLPIDLPPHSAALITSGTIAVANGGTGVTSTPANGQVLIGNGTNYTLSTLSAGIGVSITNTSGAITIATSGVGSVTSVSSGAGLIGGPITSSGTLSLATVGTAGTYAKVTTDAYGRVTAGTTLSAGDIPSHSAAIITSGTLSVANGGTGTTTLAANNVLLGGGTSALQAVAPGASGNVLISNGTTWTSATAATTNWAVPGTIGSTTPNSGAFTSITTNAQAGVEAKPFGTTAGNTGEVRFDELAANGTHYVGLKAPDTIAVSKVWVLPGVDGTSGQVLKTDGGGNLGWVSAAIGSVTSVGITAPAAGITVTGGPVTSAGSMTLGLRNDLAAVEALATTGGVERTGADTWATYTLTTAGKALLDDADAAAQRTTLGLSTLATASAVSGGIGGTITDDTIVNADIATTAAIATSKLSGAVTSITGHGLGSLATASAVSGGVGGTISDATITDADISATAAIADSKLATISTAGKVSGSAITSGIIGGSASFSTTGSITTTGNVGIGTTAPTRLLDVKGVVGLKDPVNPGGNSWYVNPTSGRLDIMSEAGWAALSAKWNVAVVGIDGIGNSEIADFGHTGGLLVQSNGSDTWSPITVNNSYAENGSSPGILLKSARGYFSSAVQNDDEIGFLVGSTLGTSTYGRSAAIRFNASENHTNTARGSRMGFFTTPNGTATPVERLRINSTGNVGIGITVPSQKLSVAGVVESTTGGIKFPDGTTQITAATIPSTTCPTGWAMVPKDNTFSFKDFCVMKYEAQSNSTTRLPVSVAGGSPMGWTSWYSAKALCQSTGAHLITNGEWMTIARNIEATAINDLNSAAGIQLATGNSDSSPAAIIVTSADPSLASCTLTLPLSDATNASCAVRTAGYSGTGNSYTGTYAAGGSNDSQLRTHILSNGAVIWDLAGNILEWVDVQCDSSTWYNVATFVEWSNASLSDLENKIAGPSGSLTSSNGSGQYVGCTAAGNGLVRGGVANSGVASGIYTANLSVAPSTVGSVYGFRCTREP